MKEIQGFIIERLKINKNTKLSSTDEVVNYILDAFCLKKNEYKYFDKAYDAIKKYVNDNKISKEDLKNNLYYIEYFVPNKISERDDDYDNRYKLHNGSNKIIHKIENGDYNKMIGNEAKDEELIYLSDFGIFYVSVDVSIYFYY